MTRPQHDSPYRDAPARSSSQPAARKARQPKKASRPSSDSRSAERARRESPAPEKSSARPRSRRGRRSGSPYAGASPLTSHPTGRAAYQETREWLLDQHGPVCAYCGDRFDPGVMTLDHVAPRRGQTAYDRRDNLVLACRDCNAQKRDLAPTAFLLARRSRAKYLLRYGSHLSPMLVELARSLVPAEERSFHEPTSFTFDFPGGESPYLD